VRPRAGVDDLEKRVFFLPGIEILSRRRATHVIVIISTELSWLPRGKGKIGKVTPLQARLWPRVG